MNDVLDQRQKDLNSLKGVRRRSKRVVHERRLRFEGAEESLRMGDIADAVHLRIFLLRRALPSGEFRQIGHEP